MSGGPVDEPGDVDVEPGDPYPLSGLDPGTTVLVAGPPLVGKYDLVLETLARGIREGDGAVLISARDDERSVREDVERIDPEFDRSMLGIVECISEQRDGSSGGGRDADVRVRRASSPADMTGIGIGASELMNDFHDAGVDGIRVGVDSLSTLLLYLEFDRLARFLHVLSGRIDRAGGLGMFVINPGTIDAGQYDQLKTLFDGLLEIRERGEHRELRVRGIAGTEQGWQRYDARTR